jgi:hypothetical protein
MYAGKERFSAPWSFYILGRDELGGGRYLPSWINAPVKQCQPRTFSRCVKSPHRAGAIPLGLKSLR